MKNYFLFKTVAADAPKDVYFAVVGSFSAIVRIESEFKIKLEPTGLINDAFGKSYISQHIRKDRVFDVPQFRKHLTWCKRCGIKL